MAVDLEEAAKRAAPVAATETVGSENLVARRDPGANPVGQRLDVVRRRDHGGVAAAEAPRDPRYSRLASAKPRLAVGRQAVAAQLAEAGDAPDIGGKDEVGAPGVEGCPRPPQGTPPPPPAPPRAPA